MKKKLLIFSLVILIIVAVLLLTGCSSKNETINTDNLKTDYLKSNNGTQITFYIPNGFTETDFLNKSDSWKGYNNGTATVDLQIITKDSADYIKDSLLKQNFKEETYNVNNRIYTKIFSVVDGKECSAIYQYKINDETYYSVSDFRKTLTDEQINTFLTVKD